jgi:4-hydroxyproline epimerase
MQNGSALQHVSVVDSHTAGEPTRLVVGGGPDLGSGPLSERMERFQRSYDSFRSAVVNEPRGSDVLVGALLCKPADPTCAAGAIFFNNVGYLGMCGHGTIGLVVTLAHMGKIGPGRHRIETPVGIVAATLHPGGRVTVQNVSSYRTGKDVVVQVPGVGDVRGDIAWGGNWFFLVAGDTRNLCLQHVDDLTEYAWKVRRALASAGITGQDGQEIDHIELFTKVDPGAADSKNFVLCPGKAYDRSPCGTGTSAKMSCLYADGKLRPGQIWRQQGILDTVFEGSIEIVNGDVIPSITGSAYVTAEATLVLDANDPFRMGIPR